MLISAKKLLQQAKKDQKAIPAFNVSSIESLQAVFQGAFLAKAPVIIETSRGESEHLTPELVATICAHIAAKHDVDYVLHMDRCQDLSWMRRCLEAGYNSISAEFGESNYGQNLALTLQARELTDQYGAQLEGVLDVVPKVYYAQQKTEKFTDPRRAQQFADDSHCDSLVVAIGTQSGRYKAKEKIRLDILKELNRRLPDLPFVLHGGSFLDEKVVRMLIQNGIAKINVNSELRIAYTQQLKENIAQKPEEYAPYRLLVGVNAQIQKIVSQKIKMFLTSEKLC